MAASGSILLCGHTTVPVHLIMDIQAVPFWTTTDKAAVTFVHGASVDRSIFKTNALECSVWILHSEEANLKKNVNNMFS